MLELPENYLKKIKQQKQQQKNIRQIITALSLVVVLGVSWGLKLTGITLAGEAFCGHAEHVHGAECYEQVSICSLEEMQAHVHTESCLARELTCTLQEQAHTHTDECRKTEYICGQEEIPAHTHSETCLQDVLICEEAECGGHHHGPECYEERPQCGLEETEGHTHDESCAIQVCVCGQEEQDGHNHSESCLVQVNVCGQEETEGHTHSESCLTRIQICGQEEREGHVHDTACMGLINVCGLEESETHSHEDACFAEDIICGMEEQEAHLHDESCFEEGFDCGQEERDAHIHEEACFVWENGCGLEEQDAHTHEDECYEWENICGLEEQDPHIHEEECMGDELVCEVEECALHLHDDSCYGWELGCGLEESEDHVHDDGCLVEVLQCTLPVCTGHFHEETCYEAQIACGLEETDGHTHLEECESQKIVCGLEETEGHEHTEKCWQIIQGFGCGLLEADGHIHQEECLTEDTKLDCGLEATQGHTHGEECYESRLVCEVEEHIHKEDCYSDLTADLETADDWEMSLAGMTRSMDTAENVVLVARSQLGYTESTRNFQVDAEGIRRGITRYGQWYGNPYGDWSAMFASFCLYYAGVEDMPANAGPEAMRLEWQAAERYLPAEEYRPAAGNLVFLRLLPETTAETDQTRAASDTVEQPPSEEPQPLLEEIIEEAVPADPVPATGVNAVAVITDVSDTAMTVIQGDWNHTVSEVTYDLADPAIVGYGLIQDAVTYAALVDIPANAQAIARTTDYSVDLFANETNAFVVYTASNGNFYAFDGNGNAVPITIDADGSIYSTIEDPNDLLWTFSGSGSTYLIQNVETGRYMHAFANNGSGVTTEGAYSSVLISSGDGVRIRSNSDYAKLNAASGVFTQTNREAEAAVYQFGVVSRCTVWLDGTDGGLGHLTGSPDIAYTVARDSVMQLPTEWTAPDKYKYRLRGWYDVTNSRYYLPGEEMVVTGNAVLYADWVADTYDIGIFNAQVADTVSTDSFITTHMFDYNYLFNLHSLTADTEVNAAGHTEKWSMVTNGTVEHGNQQTIDFIFTDNDSGGLLCMPNSRSDHNEYPGSGIVTQGVYTEALGETLFATDNIFNPNTGSGVLGKTYLGTGDHLFQYMDDPSDEHYGYYYYDSKHNAASYNQSDGRFYVYEYLEATSDAIGNTNSDFLPLNSPYANTNGQTVGEYTYDGVDGEYEGKTHYRYDSKYNSGNYNSSENVQTDYAYGMRTDIQFYLPNDPGSGGNLDLHGNAMQFEFSGDDDMWVLIDGQLVLDIGGIHGAENGEINFSTGQVTVQGNRQASLTDLGIEAGEHTLSILYLERGASLSNCSIYFNLAPRYSFTIQKEDVLSREVLNGAQFSVYQDEACTIPAELYPSEAAHDRGESPTNVFTVTNGSAHMWGMASGQTYYIKETKPPDKEGYGLPYGIIQLTFDKQGIATYRVLVLEENNELSTGFTVHGIRINAETQEAYIVATNADSSITESTTVQVLKVWDDTKDHSADYVTVYLTVTDPDGTVRRIREIILSEENDWRYTWENLPLKDADGNVVEYGVEEAYTPGYMVQIEQVEEDFSVTTTQTVWEAASSFVNGETYILSTQRGCLSATSASANTLMWVDQQTAEASALALWTARVSNGQVRLVNGEGQTLIFNYASSSNNRYFSVSTSGGTYQNFTFQNGRLFVIRNYRSYYIGGSISNGRLSATTSSGSGLIFTPMVQKTYETTESWPVENWGYRLTNIALDEETSVTVQKHWSIPYDEDESLYQQEQVTVRLLANGEDTGRTVTLTLKNGWTDTFRGLPYRDFEGNVIDYTIEELWSAEHWMITYGEVFASNAQIPTYSTTVTNTYQPGGPMLPTTGTAARRNYIVCGWSIMLGTLLYAVGSRRKRERRMK